MEVYVLENTDNGVSNRILEAIENYDEGYSCEKVVYVGEGFVSYLHSVLGDEISDEEINAIKGKYILVRC